MIKRQVKKVTDDWNAAAGSALSNQIRLGGNASALFAHGENKFRLEKESALDIAA